LDPVYVGVQAIVLFDNG